MLKQWTICRFDVMSVRKNLGTQWCFFSRVVVGVIMGGGRQSPTRTRLTPSAAAIVLLTNIVVAVALFPYNELQNDSQFEFVLRAPRFRFDGDIPYRCTRSHWARRPHVFPDYFHARSLRCLTVGTGRWVGVSRADSVATWKGEKRKGGKVK